MFTNRIATRRLLGQAPVGIQTDVLAKLFHDLPSSIMALR
jgi:hypothetical protein